MRKWFEVGKLGGQLVCTFKLRKTSLTSPNIERTDVGRINSFNQRTESRSKGPTRLDVAHSRKGETRIVWPISKLTRISSNAYPLRMRRRGTIQYEEHEPPRRTNMRVGRRRDGAGRALAGKSREKYTLTKTRAVSARYSTNERDAHGGDRSLRKGHDDIVG